MRSNWVEWVALGLSGLAIVAVVGFLVYDGLTNGGTRAIPSIPSRNPPSVSARSCASTSRS